MKINILDKWYFGMVGGDEFTPPEAAIYSFGGYVKDHPKLGEGPIVISKPVAYDPATRTIKTFSGSFYRLGEPDAEYEKMFPNAADRFHEQLSKLPYKP